MGGYIVWAVVFCKALKCKNISVTALICQYIYSFVFPKMVRGLQPLMPTPKSSIYTVHEYIDICILY